MGRDGATTATAQPGQSEDPSQSPHGQLPAHYKLNLQRVKSAPQWDRTLLSAPYASLLQSWRWGDFKRASGWLPIRVALSSSPDSDGSPLMGAQILFRKVPRLPVPVSIAYIPRGPVRFGSEMPLEQVGIEFWQSVHREAHKRGAIFLKVEPDIDVTNHEIKARVDGEMVALGFRPSGRLQPARTIALDLDRSEDELLKAMKPKTRYNLRLSERRGVRVRTAQTLQDLRAFYSLLEVTSERDEFGVHTFDYYEQLWRVFGPQSDNSALVLLAEHPDEAEQAQGPIAGLLAMRFGREAIYMYGASANRGREHMPTYLLQWKAMQWARDQGCSVYDFWGIPDPPANEESAEEVSPTNTRGGLRGVYWFKKGFGGREIEYPGAYDYVYNPLLYKIWMRWRGADLG